MAKVRRDGGVFEEETLAEKVEGAEGQVTPNVGSADSAGATPNQSAQILKAKEPILEEAVAKEDTLAGAQRLAQPEAIADEAARVKAENLEKLGSLGSRVKNRIADQFAAVKGKSATAEIDEEQINTLLPDATDEQKTAIRTGLGGLITSLRSTGADSDIGEDAAKAAYQFTHGNLDGFDLNKQRQRMAVQSAIVDLADKDVSYADALKMIKMGADQIGANAADLISDGVTMDTMFAGGGMDEDPDFPSKEDMAATIGISEEELGSMTLPEFEQKIEDLRQAELSNVSNLRAQLASTPPGSAHYQGIVDQLRAAGFAGETGIEADMTALQEQIDSADMIQVGDTAMSVEDILSDDNVSGVVDEYLSLKSPEDDERIAELKEAYGEEFFGWIDSPQVKGALEDMVNESKINMGEFATIQDAYAAMGTVGNTTFSKEEMAALGIEGYDPAAPVTAAMALAIQNQINDNPIVGMFSQGLEDIEDPDLKEFLTENNIGSTFELDALKTEMKAKMTPDVMKDLRAKGATAADIMQGFILSKASKSGEHYSTMSHLLGKPLGDFPTGPDLADAQKAIAISKTTAKNPDWAVDKNWQELAKQDFENGTSHTTDLAELPEGEAADRFDTLADYTARQKRIESMKPTMDDVMFEIAGKSGVGWKKKYEDLQTRAKWDEGAKVQLQNVLNHQDYNKDGKLDDADAQAWIDSQKFKSPTDILTGTDVKPEMVQNDLGLDREAESGLGGHLFNSIEEDGVLSVEELNHSEVGTDDLDSQRNLINLYRKTGAETGPLEEYLAGREIEKMRAGDGTDSGRPSIERLHQLAQNTVHLGDGGRTEDLKAQYARAEEAADYLRNLIFSGKISETERKKYQDEFHEVSSLVQTFGDAVRRRATRGEGTTKERDDRASTQEVRDKIKADPTKMAQEKGVYVDKDGRLHSIPGGS